MADTASPSGINATNGDPALKVRLIIDEANSSWIIGKFAARLKENLAHWNIEADIADSPSTQADINHWMIYYHPWKLYHPDHSRLHTKSTMAITHVDDPVKLRMIKWLLTDVVDAGICMSRMTVDDLVSRGVDADKLSYVTPAHDGVVVPRKIVIGITTRLYSDGRKREDLLRILAGRMRLDSFQFEIMGKGWDPIIPHLEAAGATVCYHRETDSYQDDYRAMIERIPHFDYYLYMGLDEGSMGILDALAAGVGTIVTPQGFHLDIDGGITHPFWTADDLFAVFQQIEAQRRGRIQSVSDLTWNEYASRHARLWRALLRGSFEAVSAAQMDCTWRMPASVRPRFYRIRRMIAFYGNARRSHFLGPGAKKWHDRVRKPLSRAKQWILQLVSKPRLG